MATQSYVTFKVNGINMFYQTGIKDTPSAGVDLNANIYGVWNGDGTNNLTVKNAWNANGDTVDSKNSNNGSIVTPSGNGFVASTMTYGTGKIGSYCFQFSGSNFVTLPDNTLNFTSDFSVSCWVYLPSTAGTNIIMSFDNSGGASTYNGWQIQCSGNNAYFYIYNSTGAVQSRQYNIRVPIPGINQWIHLVATKSVGQEGNIYVNGTLGSKTTSSGGGGFSTMDPTYRNKAYIGSGYFFGANPAYQPSPSGLKIDAIQTWDGVALDQTSVTELYNSGNGQEYPFTISNTLISTTNDAYGTNHGTRPSSTLSGGALGPTFTTGKIGKAFVFDGINDHIFLPNNIFKKTGDFSFSAWVNPNALSGNQAILGTYFYDGNTYGWRLDFVNSSMSFGIFGSSQVNMSIGSTFNNGQWYHIVVTRKASTGTKAYINGTLNVSNTSTINPNYATTQYSTIGATQYQPSTVTYYYNGKIDAISVWDKELSATEVASLYNSGNGKQYPFT